MRKTNILLIGIFLLSLIYLVSFISASDNEALFICGGDTESVFLCSFVDNETIVNTPTTTSIEETSEKKFTGDSDTEKNITTSKKIMFYENPGYILAFFFIIGVLIIITLFIVIISKKNRKKDKEKK